MQVNPLESRGALSIAACNSGKGFANRLIQELQRIAKKEKDSNVYQLKDTEEIVFPNGEVKLLLRSLSEAMILHHPVTLMTRSVSNR